MCLLLIIVSCAPQPRNQSILPDSSPPINTSSEIKTDAQKPKLALPELPPVQPKVKIAPLIKNPEPADNISTNTTGLKIFNRNIQNITDLNGTLPHDWLGFLGAPYLRRPEGQSEIWLYKTDACSLNLFFIKNAQNIFNLKFAEIRPAISGKPKANLTDCLNSIKAVS